MSSIGKIDHIGIVVSDMGEAIERYRLLLMKEPSHREFFEPTRVDLAFFNIGGVDMELLAPTQRDGELGVFLREKGEGLHHICFQVTRLAEILKLAKQGGMELLDEEPRPGSRNTQIAFVNPNSANGVLIEYCEYPSA